ncbi:MAG: DNA repair protein [Bacteroidales bacterium 45-6]|nr:MAG: DNA repair protein [Bacteroidales bacterium 45-6]
MKQIYQIAEVELSYKTSIKKEDRHKITSSEDAYDILMKTFREGTIEYKEFFKVLMLNQANEVVGYSAISEGGISGCIVDVRVILQAALLSNASGIIIAHNHPGGNLVASEQDLSITKKIKEGAKLIDINLLDHLILTSESYLSLADKGLL